MLDRFARVLKLSNEPSPGYNIEQLAKVKPDEIEEVVQPDGSVLTRPKQRVYVELENTPIVWRVHADGRVVSHIGAPAQQVEGCWMDEFGWVYLKADGVLGLVHSQDMVHVAEMVESGHWAAQDAIWANLPQQFAFVRSPQQYAT